MTERRLGSTLTGMNPVDRYIYHLLTVAAIVLVASGTIFFHIVEKFRWIDSYYFCVVTLATVGYGDFAPKTDLGKIGVTVYILLGVGLITALFSARLKRRGDRMRQRWDKKP